MSKADKVESILVRRATVLAPGGFVKGAWLLAAHGIIAAMGLGRRHPRGADLEVDAQGRYLLPGFIDLHVHGGGGGSVSDASAESILKIVQGHARHGTTSLLVTTFPDTTSRLEKIVKAIAQVYKSHPALLGIHLEGPHLNRKKTGGLPPGKLRRLTVRELDKLNKLSGGIIRMITLAPEINGAMELIRHCRSRGIVAAIAHTTASFEQAKAAIKAGLRHATHLPNTFVFPRNARDPGALEAVLLDQRVRAQLIAEPEIVKPQFMEIILRVKGPSRVILVTDSMRSAGLPGVKGPIRNSRGTLVGSTLTTSRAVRNVMKLGVTLKAACAMASTNPARVLGIQNKKGSLEVGKHADFIIAGKRLDCLMTVSQGRVLHLSRTLKPKRRGK